jgi:hypothetical protein
MTATALSDAAPGTADHDYRRTPGDWFLDAVKFLVPNAEARHHLLATYARIRSWVPPHPGVSPALEKTLRFHDRSLPLIIGNPVFLAAGGNKSAENLPAFADLGFGGITVGSATQTPWAGNPQRPRVRLLPRDRAMQNSMGLNNPGIERIAADWRAGWDRLESRSGRSSRSATIASWRRSRSRARGGRAARCPKASCTTAIGFATGASSARNIT